MRRKRRRRRRKRFDSRPIVTSPVVTSSSFVFCSQEVDPNRAVKKQLGDTNFYCPVALKDRGVLWPGNPEIASKFREKTYYLSTPEARDEFLENPTKFLPKDQPFTVSNA